LYILYMECIIAYQLIVVTMGAMSSFLFAKRTAQPEPPANDLSGKNYTGTPSFFNAYSGYLNTMNDARK